MTGPDPDGPEPAGSGPPIPLEDAVPSAVVTPRRRTVRAVWLAIVVILVGVVVLVTYALTSPPSTPRVVHRPPTAPEVVSALGQVPGSVFDAVGVAAPATRLTVPTVLSGQPPLLAHGKPEVVYIGAEFCPFCAAERWPLIVALSRFGHFSRLSNMVSAQYSVFPSVQTFSFVGSSYSSRYLTFTGVELYSGAVNAQGAYARITDLSPQQSQLVARYDTDPAGPRAGTGSFPFVDVGNVLATSTSGFSPGLLVGQSQGSIVDALGQPSSAVGQSAVASANYLTAGMCAATGGRPTSTCDGRGVRAAAAALGLP